MFCLQFRISFVGIFVLQFYAILNFEFFLCNFKFWILNSNFIRCFECCFCLKLRIFSFCFLNLDFFCSYNFRFCLRFQISFVGIFFTILFFLKFFMQFWISNFLIRILFAVLNFVFVWNFEFFFFCDLEFIFFIAVLNFWFLNCFLKKLKRKYFSALKTEISLGHLFYRKKSCGLNHPIKLRFL